MNPRNDLLLLALLLATAPAIHSQNPCDGPRFPLPEWKRNDGGTLNDFPTVIDPGAAFASLRWTDGQ
jgi:hypothetical protein